MRFSRLALCAVLGLALPVAGGLVAPSEARADATDVVDLAPGTQLVAVDNVMLHRAEIAKGSRVSVAQLLRHEGRVDGVSVELADGHIVKVALATIRDFFKIASP